MKNSIFLVALLLAGCAGEYPRGTPSKGQIEGAEAVATSCKDGPAICRLVCGQVYPAIVSLPENAELQRICMIKVSV